MRKIKFLHIVRDDKFFTPVKSYFDKQDTIESEYLLYLPSKKSLSFIHKEELTTICSSAISLKKKLRTGEYDVIYLHSFQFYFYRFFNCIPHNKIIIWWAWGYDIYDGQFFGIKSYIEINYLKEHTHLLLKNIVFLPPCLKHLFISFIN